MSKNFRVVIIDNYDSFTYLLADYFAQISGVMPLVVLNDKISLQDLIDFNPTHLVISPGPGSPENLSDFGICLEAISHFYNKIPILGVCLGHQGLAVAFGGTISKAPVPVHGMRSKVRKVRESKLFQNFPNEFEVMRYHSLIVNDVPKDFLVTLETDDKLVMAMEHMEFPVYGVQFHPESIGTEVGIKIIENFLE